MQPGRPHSTVAGLQLQQQLLLILLSCTCEAFAPLVLVTWLLLVLQQLLLLHHLLVVYYALQDHLQALVCKLADAEGLEGMRQLQVRLEDFQQPQIHAAWADVF